MADHPPFPPGPPMPPMMPPPPGMPGMPPMPPFGMPPLPMAPEPSLADKHGQPPEKMEEPNQTVYIKNLNEKMKEPELKKSLQAIFEQFGKILQIVAMKSYRRRGQAWIVFESVDSAQEAVENMQSFPLCGKPMVLNFAKQKSDIVRKQEGTFEPREKKPLPPKPTLPKAQRSEPESDESDDESDGPPQKRARIEPEQASMPGAPAVPVAPAQAAAMGVPQAAQPVISTYNEEPNSILFVQNLPQTATEEFVQSLFGRFMGFKEVRMVPSRPGIAFVEYATDQEATMAKIQMNGHKVEGDNAIVVMFARK